MNAVEVLITTHLSKSGLTTPRTIQALPGGTNHVFLVTVDNQQYVIKIPKITAGPLIDRPNEHHANQLAAAADISIPFYYFDMDSGINITRYQSGSHMLTTALLQQETVWRAAVRLLQRLHHLPQRMQRNLSIFAVLDFYRQQVIDQLPAELADLPAWDSWLAALRVEFSLMQIPTVPCHGDAILGNFLLTDTQLYLIDWEYAGNHDPCWDLATLAGHAELTPAQEQQLLNTYFSDSLETAAIRRYQVYKILADYLWALWCIIMQDPENAIYRWQRFQKTAFHL